MFSQRTSGWLECPTRDIETLREILFAHRWNVLTNLGHQSGWNVPLEKFCCISHPGGRSTDKTFLVRNGFVAYRTISPPPSPFRIYLDPYSLPLPLVFCRMGKGGRRRCDAQQNHFDTLHSPTRGPFSTRPVPIISLCYFQNSLRRRFCKLLSLFPFYMIYYNFSCWCIT